MVNYKLNNILINKIIDNEIDLLNLNINDKERNILKNEYLELLREYKSYSKFTKDFWKRYYKYLQSKEWKLLRQEVFKRDGYKCLLCGNKANHCHHISYSMFLKTGNSKRLECASLCKSCHDKIHGIKKREKKLPPS